VGGLISRARRWWSGVRPPPAPVVPYEVACPCGQAVRGFRASHHQVVACGGCGQSLFVLPRSAYPPPDHFVKVRASAREARPRFAVVLRPWRLPLLAALGTLAAVVLTYALVLPWLVRTDQAADSETARAQAIAAHVERGRKALAEGSFQLAQGELDAARREWERSPLLLTASDGRRLSQLHREAGLLAGLLRNSLQEILHQAAGVRRDEEWQAQFRDNYLGRGVIFDDVVRREPDGRCLLAFYEVRGDGRPARLELGELSLLRALPLDRPQRLVFGARLAGVAREPPGGWVVRFLPDSGVLLTDEEALAACAPLQLDDALRQVLRRQAEWAANLP
jgi:hypothetical protein